MDEQPTTHIPCDVPSTPLPPPPPGPATRHRAGRPAAGTVIGVLSLVYSGFALLLLIHNIAVLTGFSRPSHTKIADPLCYWLYSITESVLAIIIQVIMGVGLLGMRRWARKGMVIWLICAPVLNLLNVILLLSIRHQPAFNHKLNGPTTSAIILVIFYICVIVAITFFNGLMIYFLTRPDVVTAYDRQK